MYYSMCDILCDGFHNANWEIWLGAFATLLAGFGGVLLGAWLTDNRKKKEEQQNNINKAYFLYDLIENYLLAEINFKDDFINSKLKILEQNDVNNNGIVDISPHVSHLLPIDIKDFSFILKDNKKLLTTLYELMYYAESMDNIVKEHDNYLSNSDLDNKNKVYLRVQSLVKGMDFTCKNIIFYSHLLYIHLAKLIDLRYKLPTIKYNEAILKRNIAKDAEHNKEILQTWIDGLNKSWNE